MHGVNPIDEGRTIEWGRTSADYAQWRPDYPSSFYDRLAAHGIGTPGQRILDLGTGVGFLALQFARQGATVTGTDISEGQIEQAIATAAAEGLDVNFFAAAAEETGLPDDSIDAITASQCWPYFDQAKMIPEVRRMLRPGSVLMTSHFCWLPREDEIARRSEEEVRRMLRPGSVLMTSHFCWLPREDEIARRSEEIVLSHNPSWSAADWSGDIPPMPTWAEDDFDLTGMFFYDCPIPFTREQWCGRMRACRGVGATLNPDEVTAFEADLDAMLCDHAGDSFTVLHRIDAHLLRPK